MKTINKITTNQTAPANVRLDVASVDPRDMKIFAAGLVYNKV